MKILVSLLVLSPILLSSCAPKKEAVRNVNKYYIDCCNPALSYNEKDMCKWAKDHPGKVIVQGNTLYEMIWSDCKVGEEPWRKYK